MDEEQVILVDADDHEIGVMGKMQAHVEGLLHRAFSVIIFNSKGEMLLQKRSLLKYHSAGLWTNACCSHPRKGEETLAAANRRLMEEMGIACALKPLFSFTYKAQFNNGLIEHEYDHVFVGVTDDKPILNALEVASYEFVTKEQLLLGIQDNPNAYTPWFKICCEHYLDQLFTY